MGEWVRVYLQHRYYLRKKNLDYSGTQARSEEGGWGYYGKYKVRAPIPPTPKQQPRSGGGNQQSNRITTQRATSKVELSELEGAYLDLSTDYSAEI